MIRLAAPEAGLFHDGVDWFDLGQSMLTVNGSAGSYSKAVGKPAGPAVRRSPSAERPVCAVFTSATRLSRDEGTATGSGLIQLVEQGRVGFNQPDRLHGKVRRTQTITEEQHGVCCAVTD